MTTIQIPTHCPCCDYPLELVNDQLFCRNLSCSAQLNKKLEHFCKTLGIKGMGPKTLEKLDLQDVTEIFYLDKDQLKSSLNSETVANKLLQEIEKSKNADLATVLASFSIPLVGNTAATKICRVVTSIDEINEETCKAAGLGEKVTNNLLTWLETDFSELREFLPFSFRSQTKAPVAEGLPKVCITGKLTSYKTKQEAQTALEQAGYQVVESVTKTTDYLIDETGGSSTKRQKAEQYGITIVENLNQFLKENTWQKKQRSGMTKQ